MSNGPEAHIEMVENGFVVELFDSDVDEANQQPGADYECPWKEFIAPTMEEAFNIIRAKLPTGKSQADAMAGMAQRDNQMASDAARARFGGKY